MIRKDIVELVSDEKYSIKLNKEDSKNMLLYLNSNNYNNYFVRK